MWAKIDKVLSDFKDYHVPIICAVFALGTGIEWYHHLTTACVEFAGLVLSAITGHAIFSKTSGDGSDDSQTGDSGAKG
jgi:hypothetical protein